MTEPLVSVVLPVFNGERFLERALLSILAQDHASLDVIVIDDGSTDASPQILRQLTAGDRRLRVVSRSNRGLIASLNEGLEMARGELIARMDADDLAYPTRIRRQVEVFAQRPELAICGTDFDTLLPNGRLERANTAEQFPDRHIAIISMFVTVFRHPTVMFNRRLIPREILRYDPEYPDAEDLDLFSRIARDYPSHIIHEPLIAYRVHADSVTSTRGQQMRRSHLRVVARNLAHLGYRISIPHLLGQQAASRAEILDELVQLNRTVEQIAAARPPHEQEAFSLAAGSFYFFLMRMAEAELGDAYALLFLDETNGWARLRRRDRLPARMLKIAPALASRLWALQRKLEAVRRQAFAKSPKRLNLALDVA